MKYAMSDNVESSWKIAQELAKYRHNSEIEPIHVVYGLYSIDGSVCSQILRTLGLSKMKIMLEVEQLDIDPTVSEPPMSQASQSLFDNAQRIAEITKQNQICSEHLLLACVLYRNTPICEFFTSNVNINAMLKILNETIDVAGVAAGMKAYSGGKDERQPLPRELKDLGVDFTERARSHKIDPVIGRKEEIERIIEILCRKTKNNPVLIGEPGVGKSAVIEGLALEIIAGNVPELLKNKTVFSLDIGSLVAGTKYRGELEARLKGAIEAIMKQGNIIVFIDELHTLAQAGSKDGEVTPADMLKPYLARGELQTIGATTTDEYRKFIERDKALERRFQPIVVEPPSVEQTIEILKGIRNNYEAFHQIQITDEAINAAATLSDRYIADRFLPDKAIDLIDEAASKAKVAGNMAPPEMKNKEAELAAVEEQIKQEVRNESYKQAGALKIKKDKLLSELDALKAKWVASTAGKKSIDAEDVANVIAKWTKIPVTKLTETETERLNNLESILHKRVIGQEKAVESVSRAIRRARAGLKDPSRPIGSFMFLGPTGVGKTELTKAIAEAMFDDENNIIRLDMSEYMEQHSVSKLIGSPPGYVGFDDGGQLTEQIRRRPYSVVLFDEIEKAHQDIYNLLLQILDEGRLTDSQGRVVSFKNAIIIMTSNVGVSDLKSKRPLGFSDGGGTDANDESVLSSALKRHFRPEFLNRIDVICYFKQLTETDIRKIAEIMMNKVAKKLAERNITLRLTPATVDYIIKNGYDAEYGARPLRRIIEQTVEDTLAENILLGKLKDNTTATIDYADGKITVI